MGDRQGKSRRAAAPATPGPGPAAPGVEDKLAECVRQFNKAHEQTYQALVEAVDIKTERCKLLTEIIFRVIDHYDPDFANELPEDDNELVTSVIEMLEDDDEAGS